MNPRVSEDEFTKVLMLVMTKGEALHGGMTNWRFWLDCSRQRQSTCIAYFPEIQSNWLNTVWQWQGKPLFLTWIYLLLWSYWIIFGKLRQCLKSQFHSNWHDRRHLCRVCTCHCIFCPHHDRHYIRLLLTLQFLCRKLRCWRAENPSLRGEDEELDLFHGSLEPWSDHFRTFHWTKL